MKTLSSLILSGFLAFSASQANADVLNSVSNPGNFLNNLTTTQLVPLVSTGLNYMYFYVPVAGLTSISYNAECNAKAASAGSWVGIEVLVDGVVRAPSSSFKAFCTSSAGNVFTWGSATSTVTPSLTVGWHYVQVRASMPVGGAGWLGDSNITVIR